MLRAAVSPFLFCDTITLSCLSNPEAGEISH